MTNEVTDRKAEIGINIGVIIQGMLLAATIGFGTKLVNAVDDLSIKVGMLNTNTTLNASNISHNSIAINRLRDNFDDHVEECAQFESN